MTRTRETVAAVIWLVIAGALVLLAFADKTKPAKDFFFHWSSFRDVLLNSLILFVIPALALTRASRELLGLVRPHELKRTTGYAGLTLVGVVVLNVVVSAFGHPGKEQGIAPDHWVPHHTGQFVANFIAIVLVVPFSEELFFRGAGFGLLARLYSVPGAIVLSGAMFGLAHGILLGIPPLAFLGMMFALMRATSGSIFPSIVLHGLYNAAGIVWMVTGHG